MTTKNGALAPTGSACPKKASATPSDALMPGKALLEVASSTHGPKAGMSSRTIRRLLKKMGVSAELIEFAMTDGSAPSLDTVARWLRREVSND